MIVVDSNVLAYFLLPGENALLIEQVWNKDSHWIAPQLWKSEFRNILALYIRQQRMTLDEAREVMGEAEQMLHNKTYEVSSARVLSLVDQSGCSAYDCEFVSLAKRFNVTLVTSDKQILKQFPEVARSPEQFIQAA